MDSGTPVESLSVNIGNIDYPKVIVDSVVRKFVTNEDNERKDIELEIAQRQIDIGIAEAQGVADVPGPCIAPGERSPRSAAPVVQNP